MNLIEEQIDAVLFGRGLKAIAISAGAGAGKTGVLVERYLHAIKELGESPAELLTITFTRKAAAEIKKRIVDRLRSEGMDDEARQAQVGPISTIHGYCERLLREYPFDAGLDPRFDILSPNTTHELITQCSALILSDKESMDDAERDLLGMRGIRSYAGKRTESIEAWIIDAIESFRTAGKSPMDLERLAESSENVRESWRLYLEMCGREAGVDLPDGWLIEGIRSGGEPWMRSKAYEEIEAKAARATQGLASLAARTWRQLLAEFDRTASLDFSELESRALRLLEERPEIIKGKYKRLLIDEAQDLNPVQYALVRATPVDQMLLVGDPQQSIYGFRGAKRELFMDFLKSAEKRHLVVNWRSTELLVGSMKSVFERIWGDEYTRMKPAAVSVTEGDDPFESESVGAPLEIWKAHKAEIGISEGVRTLIQIEKVPASEITVLIRAASNLEDIVRAMRSKNIDPIILGAGKRYFQRNEIRDLGSALLAAANPYDNLSLLSLMRSPLVGISLDGCLRCAAIARETNKPILAVVGEATTLDDIDGKRVSEMFRWLIPLSESADRLPAWEVLSRILADTQADIRFALAQNASQLIANSRKLMQIAMENREMSAAEFGEWITNRQSIRISGASALSDAEYENEADDRPSIATMHSAKGLEWETVVVDASQKLWGGHRDDLRIDAFAGVLAVAIRDAGVLEKDRHRPRAHSAIAHRNQKNEIDESRRLMYVAMTRAKKRLAVVVDSSRKGACAADILAGLAPNWQGSPNVVVRDFTQPAAAVKLADT
ncbi:MAG: UvrD-helicase domain-containing protein [Armatimonadota bacterium]|nr:UvrD-helicase domain-containing protein [Armatimonadota bacterium]